MKRRETAGSLAAKAASDSTKYNPFDVGYAFADDVLPNVWQCIDNHKDQFDISEFCVVMILADDNVIANAKRRKFYAWPFLPKPRPRQAVFHYRKATDDIQMLWALPTAEAMAVLSTTIAVHRNYQRMKGWCDAFFDKSFWHHIRDQAKIDMLSEDEFLKRVSHKDIDGSGKDFDLLLPDSIDFSKAFGVKEIIDTDKPRAFELPPKRERNRKDIE